MTFYLKPAEGTISTNLFQTYAESRLKYLISLSSSLIETPTLSSIKESLDSQAFAVENLKDNHRRYVEEIPPWVPHGDCLIEGSAKDRVSHFALRTIAILHQPMHSFVLRREQMLFHLRFARMTYHELKAAVMILLKQLREYINAFCSNVDKRDPHEHTLLVMEASLKQILKKRLLNHSKIIEQANKPKCPVHSDMLVFDVPFQQALPFVTNRSAVLRNGLVCLRCDQIPAYLSLLFIKLLDYNTNKIKGSGYMDKLTNDPRLTELLESLKEIYRKEVSFLRNHPNSTSDLGITLKTLDNIAQYFPPCMKVLHFNLRSTHRLCHRPRVQYTLFLKDIGLPIADCLELIKLEYSKPAVTPDAINGNSHKCEHSWGQDGRRYIYGTRHLYGLEGARKDYSSHTCRTIQKSSPGPNECGGCPFVHYDKPNLKTFLENDLGDKNIPQKFLSDAQTCAPIEACHMHLRVKQRLIHVVGKPDVEFDTSNPNHASINIHNVYKPKHYFDVLSSFYEKTAKTLSS